MFIVAGATVTTNAELKIEGVLTIYAGGTLEGYSANLKIGNGANTGYCFNYGSINMRKIEVKGKDKTPVSGVPLLHNYDSISVGKLHSGTNSENGTASSGKTINASTGYILISATLGEAKGELHVDGELENCGEIVAETKFKPHGSTVSCCGAIYTPLVEFDLNKDRPGSLGCTNVCSASGSSTQTTWKVNGGTDYATLSSFTDNEGSGGSGFHTDTDFSIDSNNTFACGTSLTGGTWGGLGSYPLPVELIDFYVQHYQGEVLIKWTTASEINAAWYWIERSSDGISWEHLAQIPAAGNSNSFEKYEFQDFHAQQGWNFYRLSQSDFDGKSTSFPVISIYVASLESNEEFRIYPNPAQDEFYLEWLNPDDQLKPVQLEIADLSGRIVQTEQIQTGIDATLSCSTLPAGHYLLRVNLPSGNTLVRNLVIQ